MAAGFLQKNEDTTKRKAKFIDFIRSGVRW